MKVFINNTAVLNYPLADNQDASVLQSMLLDMSVVSATSVYLTNMWSDGELAGGLLTNGTSGDASCGHFSGSVRDTSVVIYDDKNKPIGWVMLGPEITSRRQCYGKWLVNPVCVVTPTAIHSFSVDGVSRVYPEVLRIIPTDYIQSADDGTFIERAPFADTQDLDARNWDINGPILSINNQKTKTGNCSLNLRVSAEYTAGHIVLSDTDNFLCTGTYTVRDNAIMDHEDYGLYMELPLDNMVRVWKGDCPRREP